MLTSSAILRWTAYFHFQTLSLQWNGTLSMGTDGTLERILQRPTLVVMILGPLEGPTRVCLPFVVFSIGLGFDHQKK